ncbi:MAG: AzlC family ABC transporter permease [Anaerovoracaceae bacterium]
MNRKLLKTVFIKTIPVMSGYLVLGFGFGILAEKSGLSVFWALIMSLVIYAGSMQYVALGLITSGASLITAALTTLMVNARHLFYGISMIERYRGSGKKKPYLMFALTDETYSLVCSGDYPEGEDSHTYCFLISFFNQIYWLVGSLAGALLGAALPFDSSGVEFSMTALFITVFVEQWLSTNQHLPAVLGVGISVICLICFGSGSFLIPAMIAITAALSVSRKYLEKNERGEADD